jgi:hypothetical protein
VHTHAHTLIHRILHSSARDREISGARA